jgi:uncharacterized protein YjiS (DUF1127 family)
MIKRYLPSFVYTYNVTPSYSAESSWLFLGANAGILGRTLRHIRSHLAEVGRRQALEIEIRRDTEQLYSLTDAQLRDIGITRMDIPRAVRFGKENL